MRRRIDFFWWAGCPSWERALAILRERLAAAGLDPEAVVVTEITSDEQARDLGFPGSPTIRVDGRGRPGPRGQPDRAELPRLPLRDGRVSPLPDAGRHRRRAARCAMSLELGDICAAPRAARHRRRRAHPAAPGRGRGDRGRLDLQPLPVRARLARAASRRSPASTRDRGVRFLQVNSNDAERYPADSLEAMRERVDAGELASPYLHDETQEAARAYGALKTPDVFVLDSDLRLRLPGRSRRRLPGRVAERRLAAGALDAVLAGGAPDPAETEPVGCGDQVEGLTP